MNIVILTPDEAARVCKVSELTVREWMHRESNPLPYLATQREELILEIELEKWIKYESNRQLYDRLKERCSK